LNLVLSTVSSSIVLTLMKLREESWAFGPG